MDDFFDEINVDLANDTAPRRTRKKMKKRRQLNALVKHFSSSTKTNGKNRFDNDVLRTSDDDDESFFVKRRKSRNRSIRSRLFSSIRKIFTLIFLIAFLFSCLSLWSNNLHLKYQIERLSTRLNRIEEKFPLNDSLNQQSNLIDEISRRISTIFQLVQMQKTIDRIDNEFNDIRLQIQQINENFVQFLRFSSNKTFSTINSFQSDLNELQAKIDRCRCSSSLSEQKSILNFF